MAANKKIQMSFKHIAIDKAAKMILGVLLIATVLVVFGLSGSRALFYKMKHQNKVIGQKKIALKQLKDNTEAVDRLVASYKEFVSASANVLGGNSNPTADNEGDRDGNNSKIILDALPSKYDFPALASSIDKILALGAYQINNITGTDDELLQEGSGGMAQGNPQPIEIPFGIGVNTTYDGAKQLITDLNRSIRPIHLLSIEFSGGETNMEVKINAKTYYLPGKSLNISTKEVR